MSNAPRPPRRPGYPAASALSELNTRPTLARPCLSALLVSGPPGSSELNLPAVKLYVEVRPCAHFGRWGHSGGPPRTVAPPEHLAPRSLSVFSWYLSANALVTA